MEVKVCSKCLLEKPLEDFHIHKGGKFGKRAQCKLCKNTLNANHKAQNKDLIKEQSKQYYLSNKESILSKNKIWKINNPDLNKAQSHNHYLNNKASYYERRNRRRAQEIHALPSWANIEAIKTLYNERETISLKTGILHHVDHIIPLQGKLVCGLHVENNLRVIPAKDNLSKGNKLEYDEIYGITTLKDTILMEKSSRIEITDAELHLILYKNEIPTRLMEQWGFSSIDELKEVINSGQCKVVNSL